MKMMHSDFAKLDRFDGNNYKRWKDKMMFLLTALKIAYVVNPDTTPIPPPTSDEDPLVTGERRKRNEDEVLCRGHILNSLSDQLYDLVSPLESPREIWRTLEARHQTSEHGTDKFLISKFDEFVMSENTSIISQLHSLLLIVSKLKNLKIELPETFIVGVIISRLPSSWKGYRKKLLHSTETYNLEEIEKHIRIEEESRSRDGKSKFSGSNVNNVEKRGVFAGKKRKSDESNSKKDKVCFHCGKKGHFKRDCRFLKRIKKHDTNQVNHVDEIDEIIAMVTNLKIDMVTEVHMATATKSVDWWYDSGATVHVCHERRLFKDYKEIEGQEVIMGNNVPAKVLGKGSVELNFTSGKKVLLVNVVHVPEIRKNLVSASLLCKRGVKAVIESDKMILSLNGVFVGKGYVSDGMYKLSLNKSGDFAYVVDVDSNLWHARLGHIGKTSLKFMAKNGFISCKSFDDQKCEVCIQSKMSKKPFPRVERNTELLELLHSDICELNGVLTRGGNRYFITFIDDCSRYTHVYLLKHKDEAFDKFKAFKALVENQLGRKIKALRSDRGGEYFSSEFSSFCEENGIIHQTSAPYTPQQNGLAERKNRTLVDMVNAMLLNSRLPLNLWGEALLTACHVHNRVPSKRTKRSPYEIWKGRIPNLSYLRVWGCLAFYRVPDPKRVKLGERALKSVLVGYADNSKAYRLLDSDSNVIVESRDVEFIENKFIFNSTKQENPESSQEALSRKKRKDVETSLEPRRSKRSRREKRLDPEFMFFLVEGSRTTVLSKMPIICNVENDPKTYTEAMTSRDASFWKEAINEEMDSLLFNNTWVIVDLPPGSKSIGNKWVFKRKYNVDGSIQTFKARLVAKGFKQKEGVDYFDTYAPVARIASIRVLLALASINKLYVHQMDVKTAFLNGDLEEEVYMDQPEGFVLPGNEKKVCRLVKSLYGLKQAPKQWHEKFDNVILSNGFVHNDADKCIYSKFTDEYGVIICLYVDDMLIVGTNMKGIDETKKYLTSSFKMKDLNEVDMILGIKVRKNSGGYSLSQTHYVDKIVSKFSDLNFKESNSPYDTSVKLEENSGRAIDQLKYASAIGSLMYAMHCTRPDIAFAVCKLSRYTSNPGASHWKAIGRIFGYLKRTKDFGLHYEGYPAVLEGYSDASWITSVSDNKSTSGYVFTLGGSAVSWSSKKQTCITHSTMESEFVALAAAGKEAEWLRNLLLDIELWPQPMPAISLYCDSEATMSSALNRSYNGRSRHISLRHSYIRQLVEDGVITITYVKSCKNIADPLTKGLSRDMVQSTSRGMGLKPI